MELELNEHEKMQNCYESLLLRYAAGTLDMAQNLVVEAHLTLSPYARDFVHSCECLGGTLIENECCDSVRMRQDSLDKVLSKLDTPACTDKPCCTDFQHETITFDVHEPLKTPLSKQKKITWKAMMPGFKTCDIDLECKKSMARLMQISPGLKTPHHKHKSTEITLILDGAFSDENGTYTSGDLIVTDSTIEHTPTACKDHGCTCLIVSSDPVKLTGIAALLNPFLKP